MATVAPVQSIYPTVVANFAALRSTTGAADRVVTVQGYSSIGDGGGGTFFWDPTNTTADDNGIHIAVSGVSTGRWKRIHTSAINVKWFGATGDGTTDDTAAIKKARDFVMNRYRVNPAPLTNSNKLSYGRLYFPTGSYRITEAQALMSSTFTMRTVGYHIEGESRGSTQIIYDPPTPGGYLFYNNNAILVGRIKNVTFNSTNAANNFMYSDGNNGAQDWGFVDVAWGGAWNYGVHLRDYNNNSEFFFDNCNWSGTITTALYSQDSDQFLNYWFNECKFWAQGELVDFEMGGHIKIMNCDFSDYRPDTMTYLFNLRGASHARGVCSFVCMNSRFELKTANSGVIQCYWPSGNVVFDNCDFGSQSPNASSPTTTTALFSFVNVEGPAVEWRNCMFLGKHEYRFSSNNYQTVPAIRYINCASYNNLEPNDFLTITNNSGSTNPASVPTIRFQGWRGNQSSRTGIGTNDLLATDINFNWQKSARATLDQKAISIRAPDGGFPNTNGYLAATLPVGAMVTMARLYAANGHTTNGNTADYGVYLTRNAPILSGGSGMGPTALTLTAGTMYRIRFTTSGRTTGTLKVTFQGGTVVTGTLNIVANRTYNEVLTAATGNTGLQFTTSDGFDGTVSNITVTEVVELARTTSPTQYRWGFNVASAANMMYPVTSKDNATVEVIDRSTAGLSDARGNPFCLVEYYG